MTRSTERNYKARAYHTLIDRVVMTQRAHTRPLKHNPLSSVAAMSPQQIAQTCIYLLLPCLHPTYYPAEIAHHATRGQHAVFMAFCSNCIDYYLVSFEESHKIQVTGDVRAIVDRYTRLSWQEFSVPDVPFPFLYKLAPSLEALHHEFQPRTEERTSHETKADERKETDHENSDHEKKEETDERTSEKEACSASGV